MDNEFKQPKLYFGFSLYNLDLNKNARNILLTSLVIRCFNDSLSKYSYVFSQASLSCNVSFNSGGSSVDFYFGGYNQKLPVLVDTVLSKFCNINDVFTSEARFNDIFEMKKRDLKSQYKNKAYMHCKRLIRYLLVHNKVLLDELIGELDKITFKDVQEHYKTLFCNQYIEGLLFGKLKLKLISFFCFCIVNILAL